MVYTPHEVNKLQKISEAFIPLVEDTLFLPNLFQRSSIDIFKGALGDTISVSVPGVLRAHEYAFRNDRANPLVVDTFEERRISMGVNGNAYSAVELTDEQKEFDLISWGKVMPMQADAVAEYLNRAASAKLANFPLPVLLGVGADEGELRQAITGAKLTLDKFRTGKGSRFLIVGSEFEARLLNDGNLNLASNVGDTLASKAVQEATLGRISGFTVISGTHEIADDEALAVTSNAMIWFNGAPQVPNSAPYGTTVGQEGLSLRHILDYDTMYLRDRSVVNTWFGFNHVTDVYKIWDSADKREEIQTSEHFTRAIKLKLGADNAYTGHADLTAATGVNTAFLDKVNAGGNTTP